MKTKYTPGPWEVSGSFVGKSIPGEAYHLIVDAHPGSGRYDVSEETAANLKLIAASPEMLAQLQAIIEWFEARNMSLGKTFDMIYQNIQSTVEKATK